MQDDVSNVSSECVCTVLSTSERACARWVILGALTVACVLYCDLELSLVHGAGGRGALELRGLGLAVLKARSEGAKTLSHKSTG